MCPECGKLALMSLVPDIIAKQDEDGVWGVFWVNTDYVNGPSDQETLVWKQHSTNTFRIYGKMKCLIIIRLYCSLKYSSICTQSNLE